MRAKVILSVLISLVFFRSEISRSGEWTNQICAHLLEEGGVAVTLKKAVARGWTRGPWFRSEDLWLPYALEIYFLRKIRSEENRTTLSEIGSEGALEVAENRAAWSYLATRVLPEMLYRDLGQELFDVSWHLDLAIGTPERWLWERIQWGELATERVEIERLQHSLWQKITGEWSAQEHVRAWKTIRLLGFSAHLLAEKRPVRFYTLLLQAFGDFSGAFLLERLSEDGELRVFLENDPAYLDQRGLVLRMTHPTRDLDAPLGIKQGLSRGLDRVLRPIFEHARIEMRAVRAEIHGFASEREQTPPLFPLRSEDPQRKTEESRVKSFPHVYAQEAQARSRLDIPHLQNVALQYLMLGSALDARPWLRRTIADPDLDAEKILLFVLAADQRAARDPQFREAVEQGLNF